MDDSKYQGLINKAAAEYSTAAGEYRALAEAAGAAKALAAELEAENAAIAGRLRDFEAGRVSLEADDFIDLEARRRYLEIRIKQQNELVRQADKKLQLAVAGLNGIAGQYRHMLEGVLRDDYRVLESATRARLEAVLK